MRCCICIINSFWFVLMLSLLAVILQKLPFLKGSLVFLLKFFKCNGLYVSCSVELWSCGTDKMSCSGCCSSGDAGRWWFTVPANSRAQLIISRPVVLRSLSDPQSPLALLLLHCPILSPWSLPHSLSFFTFLTSHWIWSSWLDGTDGKTDYGRSRWLKVTVSWSREVRSCVAIQHCSCTFFEVFVAMEFYFLFFSCQSWIDFCHCVVW